MKMTKKMNYHEWNAVNLKQTDSGMMLTKWNKKLENSNRQRRPFHHIKLTLYRHIRTAEHRTIVQQYGDC